MKLNTAVKPIFTHEGAKASHLKPIDELKRTVLACMLWESNFYESGESVAERIQKLVPLCDPCSVVELAVETREKHHLRHVPLLLVRELARDSQRCESGLISKTLFRVIQRADELAEFLMLYWREGRRPLSKQVKKGLALAFTKFNEYSLAKYNRDNIVKLRDVLFLVHAKPRDEEQAKLWKKLVENKLETPDTWEVALSAGADKKETFERLLRENQLGYLALLRNLRNMQESNVDTDLIFSALHNNTGKSKVLPFRFIAAARAVPMWENQLDEAMQLAMSNLEKLPGKTAILVDASGSMTGRISNKSDLTRFDAAAALAILTCGIAEECRVFRFNKSITEVPPRKGMALVDAFGKPNGGTLLGMAVEQVRKMYNQLDRLIVITDEQSQDTVGAPGCKGYMINVASYQNSVGYGDWIHISGFSEAVMNYIMALESKTEE
jgi:hypothetical protein